ncbi:alcohol dehydrogenase [Fusarium acutatum]|uniref:Alcohol dehydrogenase n=1 Tax=Fusarium acutatum TaxID=78861 RepID=A0A8H4K3D6_9HYPO|nr:alcohol dehydrogenase [Fusarium acutatum]
MVKEIPFGGIAVPSPGFGAMGMSFGLGSNLSLEEAEPVLLKAIELGCTFWDTAVVYQAGVNEKLLGDFIRKHNVRDKVFIASKCGFDVFGKGGVTNSASHIKEYIEGTIERLGFAPDLYYLHRIDPNTPLEESIPALDEIRKQGKTKYIGLSECSANTLRKANSIAKIDAVQAEYSAFETLHETDGLIDTAKELGIAYVAYSPLGHGWLVDDFPYKSPDDFAPDDFRRTVPKFQGENFYKNKAIVEEIKKLAVRKGCTLTQIALAWVASQEMIAIPGTTKAHRLEENWASRDVDLTEEEKAEMRRIIDSAKPQGNRYSATHQALVMPMPFPDQPRSFSIRLGDSKYHCWLSSIVILHFEDYTGPIPSINMVSSSVVKGQDVLAGLDRFKPLPDLRTHADDWTGVTSRRERKRRQNRLNQRAWRRRKAGQNTSDGQQCQTATAASARTSHDVSVVLSDTFSSKFSGAPTIGDGILLIPDTCEAERLRNLIRQSLEDYSLQTPRPSNLHIIIRLNVLNAIADNATAIGFPKESLCRDEFISPFYQIGPILLPSPGCPTSLQPTSLQRSTAHHPWIDLFPFPKFRDNVLDGMQKGLFDDDELCGDLLGVEGAGVGEQPSLLVWTVAWDAKGWEVNAAFVKKWGSLIQDCPEIMESTNYWRRKRGQHALTFDVDPGTGP